MYLKKVIVSLNCFRQWPTKKLNTKFMGQSIQEWNK